MSSSGGEAAAELAALLDTATAALTAWAAADPQQLSAPALGGRLAAFGALAAQVGVAALAAADPQQLADAALGEGIVALGTVGGQLEAQRLRWLAVFDGRGAGAGDRGGSTAGWLGWHTRQGPRHSARIVRLARSLHRQLPATHAALAAGDISVGHADVLAQGTDDLPEDIVAAGEPTLVEAARRLTPHQLRAAVLHWRAHVAPEQVDRDFAAHHERRRLHVSSTLDGLVALDGLLDAEAGNTVLTAISALAGPGGGDDPRTSAQRRADALVDLARHALDSAELPDTGGDRPHINVQVDLQVLLTGTGAADLDFTGPIPAERARQLACDAGISRIITAGASQPLDVGRRTRTVPTHLRRALVTRDRGCVFPGCDRPPAWCDSHHRQHWADGGPTVLSNLVLLCRFHHGMIHRGWTLTHHPDGTTTATPPPDSTSRHGPPEDSHHPPAGPPPSGPPPDPLPDQPPAAPPETPRGPAPPDLPTAA